MASLLQQNHSLRGIERGEVNVALVNIVKLAAALELSVEALMKEAGL